MDTMAEMDLFVLSSGQVLDVKRRRSDGPLDREALAFCRKHDLGLAYDPAQIGWVPIGCLDDIDPAPALPEAEERRAAELARRYRLRPWRPGDVARFVALLDDARVWEHLPESYPAPLTEATARDLIELSNAAAHHEVLAAEVAGKVGGAPVGQVRLAFDPGSGDRREGEISYWLGRNHWGRGIGGDLVLLYTLRCFERRPGLETIVARVHERNPASARVLEKAGYRPEGPMPAAPGWHLWRRSRRPS